MYRLEREVVDMRVIYAHDEKLQVNNGIYYSTGSLGNGIENKYLKYFNQVTLLMRSEELSEKTLNNSIIKKISHPKVEVQTIPDLNTLNILQHLKARKIIKENVLKSDKIIARLPSNIGNLTIHYAKKYKKDYGIELVGCPYDALRNHGSMIGRLLAPYLYFKTKWNVKNSPLVLYVTNEFLQTRYPTKNIYSCSDVEIELKPVEKVKQKLNNFQTKSSIDIGIIGTLTTKYKGHYELFKVISLLKNKYNITLHLIGYGDLMPWNDLIDELQIRDIIKFDGVLESGTKVWEWLDQIDIYVQPSYTEGMPRSTIEAMSRGCAVVTTNVGGFKEIIHPNFMVDKQDYISLLNKIELLIKDNEAFIENSMYHYNRAKEFLPQQLEKKREAFYKNI